MEVALRVWILTRTWHSEEVVGGVKDTISSRTPIGGKLVVFSLRVGQSGNTWRLMQSSIVSFKAGNWVDEGLGPQADGGEEAGSKQTVRLKKME